MYQLLYVSTSREPITQATVEEILAQSRRNNRRDDLTGLLIVGGRRFLQLLEGDRALVEAAYRRIQADSRHFAMVQLGAKDIDRRSFPEWQMGYRAGPDTSGSGDLATIVERLTEGVEDASLRAHLRSFAALHRDAA